MVHDERITPLTSSGGRLRGGVGNSSIQKQVVNLGLTKFVQRCLRERLHTLEIRQVQWQDSHWVGSTVKFKGLESIGGRFGVSCSENDAIRLGLLKKLLEYFDALDVLGVVKLHCGVGLTKPEDRPVATIVFATEFILLVIYFRRLKRGMRLLEHNWLVREGGCVVEMSCHAGLLDLLNCDYEY